MYIAEWIEDGVLNSKIFDCELSAHEFAVDAYLDCLVSVSVRPHSFGSRELDAEWEWEQYMVEANQP